MWTQTNPTNWFEIPVSDLNRAKEFYEYIFGTELILNEMGPMEMAWFPMIEGAPGATGTLMKSEGYIPSHQGILVYFSVENIEDVLKKVTDRGGNTLNPKTSIGEYGYIAHFEDCEGNRVGLHAMQ